MMALPLRSAHLQVGLNWKGGSGLILALSTRRLRKDGAKEVTSNGPKHQ